MPSGQLSNALLGLHSPPDSARKIVLTVQIPVFADADTGYGDAISTHYTVREYIQAGIAGAHIPLAETRAVSDGIEIRVTSRIRLRHLWSCCSRTRKSVAPHRNAIGISHRCWSSWSGNSG
jgi:hypothetical protein